MSLMPEGGSKSVCNILCTAVLVLSLLQPFRDFDFESYAAESAKLMQAEEAFSRQALESAEKLNRSVIERQYREYILDKARELGAELYEVQVKTRWSVEEVWVPQACEIKGEWSEEQKLKLERLITDELGIPKERQSWTRG